jgi:hypothetical protein
MAGFPSAAKGNRIGEKAKRPHPGVPLDKTLISELVVQHTGNLSRVADAIGTTRGIVRRVIDKDPELQQLLIDQRERQIDQLEASCFERAIDSNDTTLQLFLLKTQGRHRGYEQNEAQNAAKDIATAAFDFIVNKTKNPAEQSK